MMAVMDGVCVCVCGHGEAVLDDHDTQSNTVDINIMLPSSPSLPPPIFPQQNEEDGEDGCKTIQRGDKEENVQMARRCATCHTS